MEKRNIFGEHAQKRPAMRNTTKQALSALIISIIALPSAAQEIIQCSPEAIYWYIEDEGKKYTLNLYGDVATSTHPNVINVEDKALQYLIARKAPFLAEESNSNSDILVRFADDETAHINELFKTTLEVDMKMATFDDGLQVLLWQFAMPEGNNEEVERQIYANTIVGDIIFGLGSPVFHGQDSTDTVDFILNTLASLRTVADKKSVCK